MLLKQFHKVEMEKNSLSRRSKDFLDSQTDKINKTIHKFAENTGIDIACLHHENLVSNTKFFTRR